MPRKSFFAFSPDEILDLEEAVNQVLPVVLAMGQTLETGNRIQVSARGRHKNELSATDLKELSDTHGGLDSFWDKNDFCCEILVCLKTDETKHELVFRFPGIEGLSPFFLSSFIGKRIQQLLIATAHSTLAVNEFGNEYFYVYRRDNPDSGDPMKV